MSSTHTHTSHVTVNIIIHNMASCSKHTVEKFTINDASMFTMLLIDTIFDNILHSDIIIRLGITNNIREDLFA